VLAIVIERSGSWRASTRRATCAPVVPLSGSHADAVALTSATGRKRH